MKRFLRQNYLLVLLISIYLITRLFHLTILPIFNDESIYLYWAKLISSNHAHFFISLTDGKSPLLIWIMAVLLKLLPSSWYLLAGRLPSVFFGLLSCIGIYALAQLLFQSRRTAVLAAILYTLSPFALFYDRLALFDGFLLSMVLWAVYFAIRTSQSLAEIDALAWGFFLGMAFLAKVNALIFLFLTPLAFVLLLQWKHTRKQWPKLLFILGFALSVSQLIRYSLLVSRGYHEYTIKSVTRYALPFSTVLTHPFQVFPANIFSYLSWFISYVTFPVFLLCVIGFLWLAKTRWRIGIALFLLWALPIIATSFVSLVTSPRYILYTLPYFLIPAAFTATQMLKTRLSTVILGVLLVVPFLFDTSLLLCPPAAPLPAADYNQYVSGTPSGYGLERIFSFLHQKSASGKITVVTLGTISSYPYAFNLEFWRNPNVRVIAIWPVSKDTKITISKLAKSSQVYVVIKSNSYQDHSNFLKELNLKEILKAEKPNSHNPILLAMPQD